MPGQKQPQQIDLSAGLVPAASAAPPAPSSSPGIDLSAGMVPAGSNPAPERGIIGKAWDWLNKGLVSGDTLLNAASAIAPRAADQREGESAADYVHRVRDSAPTVEDSQHPILSGIKKGLAGTVADTYDTAAGFTSPLSIGTMAVGAAGKIPGTAGKIARAMSAVAGTGFAGKGASDVVDAGLENTPEAWQKRLTGGAMVAGGAAGVKENAIDPLMQKAAPGVAEGALGVTKMDRRRLPDKGAIGKAVLNDMKSNAPEDILDEANERVANLSSQLDELAEKSNKHVSLKPAYDVLDEIGSRAASENSAAELKIVKKIRQQLSTRFSDNSRIPSEPSAREALDLKRGIGKLKNWDSPSESALAAPIIDRVYGAIDGELDKALPTNDNLNRQLTVTMKIANRAEDLTNQPGIFQKGFDRIAKPTGALIAPVGMGAAIGGALAGPPGAAIGSIAGGLTLPFAQEAISAPATKMKIARGMLPTKMGRVGTAIPPAARPVIGSIAASMNNQRR